MAKKTKLVVITIVGIAVVAILALVLGLIPIYKKSGGATTTASKTKKQTYFKDW